MPQISFGNLRNFSFNLSNKIYFSGSKKTTVQSPYVLIIAVVLSISLDILHTRSLMSHDISIYIQSPYLLPITNSRITVSSALYEPLFYLFHTPAYIVRYISLFVSSFFGKNGIVH